MGLAAVSWLWAAWPALAAVGLGWEVWWDGGPCSLWGSCSVPWVWQPESLGAPFPTGNKPSGLSGPVPEYWCNLQSCHDNSSRPLIRHQDKQCAKAVSSCCVFLIKVGKDVSHNFWHLEETQVRVVLPLQCSPVLGCPALGCPANPSVGT